MTGKHYAEEFKIGAIRQLWDRGYTIVGVATRFSATKNNLYRWMKRRDPKHKYVRELNRTERELGRVKAELARVKAELARVAKESDIPDMAAITFDLECG